MSFAVDLSPAGNMDYSSGISSQLFNLVLEAAIFVASELFLRSFDTRRGSAQQSKLLLIQGLVLLVSSGALYLYKGVPYFLLLFSLLIIGRLLFTKGPSATHYSHNSKGVVVSKPLGHILKNTNIQENYTPNYYNESWVDNGQRMDNSNEDGYQSLPLNTAPEKLGKNPQTKSNQIIMASRPRPSTDTLLLHQRLSRQDNSHVQPANSVEEKKPTETFFSLKMSSPSVNPPGLTNRGNTCFVNSIIQCLVWVPKFSDVVVRLAQKQLQSEKESKFINCLEDVISQCQCLPDGHKVLNPVVTDHLLSSISAVPQYLVVSAGETQTQQDAAEFLQWLLNNLHSASSSSNSLESSTDEKRVKALRDAIKIHETEISEIGSNDLARLESPMQKLSDIGLELHLLNHSSLIHDLFMGQFLEVRQCTRCSRITTNSEYFTILPLPIITYTNEKIHLRDCLRSFSSPESLAQDNMIACSCSQEGSTATRLSILSVIPDILIIQLSRFTFDSVNRSSMKNNFPVYFDSVFDIFEFSLKKKFQPQIKESLCYSLQAFCAHSGGHVTLSGHYVSYCKATDGQWYYYNDDHVTLITDIGQELETEFVLQNAYILFYTKC